MSKFNKQISNKQVRDLLEEEPGWSFVRRVGSGHFMVIHGNGQRAILPSSPSDHRTLKNCRSMLRRMARMPHKE